VTSPSPGPESAYVTRDVGSVSLALLGTRYASRAHQRGTGVRHMSTAESNNTAQVSCGSNRRLAVYGTLAPGRPNHHQLRGLSGRWIEGTVRGQLLQEGWGAEHGYPGLILDPDGPTVDVQLLESSDLPEQWTRLDEFEGSGYRRTVTTVSTGEGDLSAFIYVLAQD